MGRRRQTCAAAVTAAALLSLAVVAYGQDEDPESAGPIGTIEQPVSLAVLDFSVIGTGVDPSAGEALATVIRSALAREGSGPRRVRVIERTALKAILTEQDLQLTDMVDPNTAVKVGRIAGVDRLVMGSIARVGQTYTVTSRVVEVETGEAADADEFVVGTLDNYPQLARLLAALIGEQPIGPDSIAGRAYLSETFDGAKTTLQVGPLKNPGNGTALDKGRYLMSKASKGNHYWWVPGVKEGFYLQVDLAQLEGPPEGGCGVVWGARGTGDYLSLRIGGGGHVRLERRQGGTTSTTLTELVDWPVVNPPPKSNRVRIESWKDRHRVFVNGACVDDFYEPGYRGGKVGLRTHLPGAEMSAEFAADNLVAGALQPAKAGITTEPVRTRTGKTPTRTPRKEPVVRSQKPWARINKVWLTEETDRRHRGLTVHVAFEIANYRGRKVRATAYFRDAANDRPLRDHDGQYRTTEGWVATGRDFSPQHRVSSFSDLALSIPTSQLHVPFGRSKLECYVVLWDESQHPRVKLARSDAVAFTTGR